jgi:hypothetical protein
VIVYFGQICENYKSSPHFRASFSAVKNLYALILTKNGFGYILGDSFTNSSGRPAANKEGNEMPLKSFFCRNGQNSLQTKFPFSPFHSTHAKQSKHRSKIDFDGNLSRLQKNVKKNFHSCS